MRRFEQEIAAWTDGKLNEFLDYRQWVLTEGPGNICIPASDPHVAERAPFMARTYPYRQKIGSLSNEPWLTICDTPAKELIDPNPFALSRFRNSGLQCWDAAIGVQASDCRTSKVISMAETPLLKGINNYWKGAAAAALEYVGPLGDGGAILRPEGPWLIDFTKIPDGWRLLEAAHVLAHMRGDTKRNSRSSSVQESSTAGWLQAAVSLIAVSLLFDLPLYIGLNDEGVPAEPDFKQYGVEVKSTGRFGLPYLRAPWANREALRMDETIAVVSVAVFTQPHPNGFTSGTLVHTAHDKWCCIPTIAMISGWETVDVITHQPLVSSDPNNDRRPVCYGMHPSDMMPPHLLWPYLALGCRAEDLANRGHARGLPVEDDTHMYVYNWLNSEDYAKRWLETPTLPCKKCMTWNYRADGRPIKPFGPPPKPNKLSRNREWSLYYKEVSAVESIIERSVKDFEGKLYGDIATRNRLRKARKRGCKAKQEKLKELRWLDEAIKKSKEGKTLTRHHARVYKQYILDKRSRRSTNDNISSRPGQ